MADSENFACDDSTKNINGDAKQRAEVYISVANKGD
jgi:hypothetical protein